MGNCIKSSSIANSELPSKKNQWTVIPVSSQPVPADISKVHPEGQQIQLIQGKQPEKTKQEGLAEQIVEILDSPFEDIDPLRCQSGGCSQDVSKVVNNHKSKSSHKSQESEDSVNCESVHLHAQNIHLSHTSSAIIEKEGEQPQQQDNCSEANEIIPRIDPTQSHLINPSTDLLGVQLKEYDDMVYSEMIASQVLKKRQSEMKSTDETVRVQEHPRNNIEQSVIMIQTHKRQ